MRRVPSDTYVTVMSCMQQDVIGRNPFDMDRLKEKFFLYRKFLFPDMTGGTNGTEKIVYM